MKIPTVSNFLYFFDLTTGGLFLGYIGAVANAGCVLALFYELLADKEDFKEEVYEFAQGMKPLEVVVEEVIGHKPVNRNDFPVWAIVLFASLWIGILVICTIFSVWFIQGIHNRDPQKIPYFLFIMGVGTISSFLTGLFSVSFAWILVGMANVYFFICVYSLYQVLQYEDVEQAKSYANVDNEGYTQCYESDMLQGEEENRGSRYQTTEFNEP